MEAQKYNHEEINKQNEELENKQKFDKAFEEEITTWKIVGDSFNKIIEWEKYNDNLSNKENFENAFCSKIWKEIDNLSYTDEETKINLKIQLEQEVKVKPLDELLKDYEKLKNDNRNWNEWELAQNQKELAWWDKQNKQNEKSAIDKLKDEISKNNETAEAKLKEKQEIARELRNIEWEERQKELSELNSLEFPVSKA